MARKSRPVEERDRRIESSEDDSRGLLDLLRSNVRGALLGGLVFLYVGGVVLSARKGEEKRVQALQAFSNCLDNSASSAGDEACISGAVDKVKFYSDGPARIYDERRGTMDCVLGVIDQAQLGAEQGTTGDVVQAIENTCFGPQFRAAGDGFADFASSHRDELLKLLGSRRLAAGLERKLREEIRAW